MFKAEAEVFFAHVIAQLTKSHGDSVIAKLDLDVQNAVKTVVQKEGVPLHPEEVEIENASEIKID